MFKIESYITPLLMGYVDKYVKLRHEDFQLSLWGGDAVLNNLDLRLDVIEKAIQLPIIFKSGHIHELRIHVPWTKLGSEPIVITINTIECILKLRESAYNDTASSQTPELKKSRSFQAKQKQRRQQAGEDLPPGYLQSLMNKISNNVSIVINNLIVKFVEDDIVLSINVKSLECFSVNELWSRAFIDLCPPELALRKSINLSDLTICLDKCDSSGKIENYQDPMVYRCSVTGRVYLKYDSINAKFPSITKFDLFCETLDVSLTDTQLPLFFRLIELCLALYYGTLEFPSSVNEQESSVKSTEGSDDKKVEDDENQRVEDPENQQSWSSWAWSYVPQILPTGEEELQAEERSPKKKPPPAVLAVGMYAHKASLTFKLTEKMREKVHYGPQKIAFRPFMYMEAEGIGVDIVMKGLTFFNVQFGISNISLETRGNCICGTDDAEDQRSKMIVKGGDGLSDKVVNYYSRSLFDLGCPVNQGQVLSWTFDGPEHLQTYTEQAAIDKFGVFFVDYLYVMQPYEDSSQMIGSTSSISEGEEPVFLRETSLMRYIVGSCQFNISSSAVHRVQRFIQAAQNHSYEPYAKTKDEVVDDQRPAPTDVQVLSLENVIPTRTQHLTIIQPFISVYYAQHENCDISKKSYKTVHKPSKVSKEESNFPKPASVILPVVAMTAVKFEFQVTNPMYPRKLIKFVSKMAAPSANLLHNCHSHTQFKLFGAAIGLQTLSEDLAKSHVLSLVPEFSGAIYNKRLLLSMYWNSKRQPKTEQIYELPQATVNFTKASLLLLTQIVSSWQQKIPKSALLTDTSLLRDNFVEDAVNIPVLELSVSGMEMKKCKLVDTQACTGTLSSVMVTLYLGRNSPPIPVFTAPADTSKISTEEFFMHQTTYTEESKDFLTIVYQIPKDQATAEVPTVALLNMEGFVCNMDQLLNEWFNYTPTLKKKSTKKESQVSLDLALAEATIPLQRQRSKASSAESTTHKTESVTKNTSQVETKTITQSASQRALTNQKSESEESGKTEDVLGKWLSGIFPYVKSLYLQVDVKCCCLFLSSASVMVSEPSSFIPLNIRKAMFENPTTETIVFCLPNLKLYSSGGRSLSRGMDIPITSLEGPLKGERLPWQMSLDDFSVYSLHGSDIHSLVKPASVSCTVAVTSKYDPLSSDNISALGLCLHTDMKAVTLSCSKPQVKLCARLAMSLLDMGTDVRSLMKDLLPKPVEKAKKDENPETPPVVEPTSNKSIVEDVLLSETETSGENKSRGTTPSQDLEYDGYSKDRVRLSLWLQWTLPKLELRFYKHDKITNQENRVTVQIEDIALSVDVQEIYAKVKVTCNSANVHHFDRKMPKSKNELTHWEEGPFLGILMSCKKEISDDIQILSHKTGFHSQHSTLHKTGESQSRDVTHGFLNFTFTRALCKNVAKKMRKLNADLAAFEEFENEAVRYDLYFHKHISEMCLNTEPCDFIMYIPAVHTVLNSFESLIHPKKSTSVPKPVQIPEIPAHQKENLPVLTSSSLPLLYVTISNVRVFIPKTSPVEQKGHDLALIILPEIAVNPQVDNPLPRYAVEREIYHKAMQLNLTQQPGSAIENRQYQIDIQGLSICTGKWGDFLQQTHSERQKDLVKPKIQIPALEWNTVLKPFSDEREPIKLVPILFRLDMKIVAAPAIVYISQRTDIQPVQKILVCGHSLEVNVTNKLNIYAGTSQIKLFEDLALSALSSLSGKQSRREKHSRKSQPGAPTKSEVSVDSGLGSDVSSVRSPGKTRTERTSVVDHGLGSRSVTPFDLLLTANVVSCTLFRNQGTEKRVDLEDDVVIIDKADVADMGSEKNSKVKERKESTGDSCHDPVIPFLHLYLWQPHTVLSCHHDTQKFEISCYDISLKGPHKNITPTDLSKQLPNWSTYGVSWIETRPGEPNPKTGIPPSLCTLSVADLMMERAKIGVKVERPVKVNLSLDKVQHIQNFLSDIIVSYPCDQSPEGPSNMEGAAPGGTEKSGPPTRETTTASSERIQAVLSKIGSVDVVCNQMVVAMETDCVDEHAQLFSSVEEIQLEVNLIPNQQNPDKTEGLTADLYFWDLTVSTGYRNKTCPFLGPLSLAADAVVRFYEDDCLTPLSLPRVVTSITVEHIHISFGQEHVKCFKVIGDSLKKFIDQLQTVSKKSKDPPDLKMESEGAPVESLLVAEEFSKDDLRTGKFQYVMNPDNGVMFPAAGQIVFCNEDHNDEASMTWSYSQPRVISHMSFTPIPFNLPQNFPSKAEEKQILVPCALQYYDVVTKQFVTYIQFDLSENLDTVLELPEVKVHLVGDLVVAKMWRVLIKYNQIFCPGHELTEEDLPDRSSILLPTSLAASVKIDSSYLPCLIPVLQCYVNVSLVGVHLYNHFRCLGSGVPSKLHPFVFDGNLPEDQMFTALTFRNSSLQVRHLVGDFRRTAVQLSGSASVQVTDYGNLTDHDVIKPFIFYGDLCLLPEDKRTQQLDCNLTVDPVFIRFGKGALHTLNRSLQAWNQVSGVTKETDRVILSHYIICNDTSQPIRFGQVGTDENIVLESRHMHCYSWRSQKAKQEFHLCVDGKVWKWSEPFDINTVGSVVRVMKTFNQQQSLIITVKQISNVQKQVTIHGQLMIASHMSLPLNVRIFYSTSESEMNQSTIMLHQRETGPSHILEPEHIKYIKVRAHRGPVDDYDWSSEVYVSAEKLTDSRTVMITMPDKSKIHIWCHVICQHVKSSSRVTVLLCPLYVIRSQLPRQLIVHIETPSMQQTRQVNVPGKGRELQLECLGAAYSHNLTFQLSQGLEKSSSSVTLTTGLINQITRSSPSKIDVEAFTQTWRKEDGDHWPYCFTDVAKEPPGIFYCPPESAPDSNHQSSEGTDPRDFDLIVSQPSLDLHVNLSEYWPGCGTLLVDVSPWCLMTNQTDLDLMIVEQNGTSWQLPSKKTFTPPKFKTEFVIGVVFEGSAFYTSPIPLSDEEVELQLYRPDKGRILFIDGYLQTRILIKHPQKNQICFLTLQSSVKKNMRIIVITETFNLCNLTPNPMTVSLNAIPVSNNKVNLAPSSSSNIQSHLKCKKDQTDFSPLLTWNALESTDVKEEIFSHYISIKTIQSNKSSDLPETHSESISDWSHPVRMIATEKGTKLTLAVPTTDGDLHTRPVCVTGFFRQGIHYYVVREDESPSCLIYNKTTFPLCYGHQNLALLTAGIVVQEETELLSSLPTIPPHRNVFYTPLLMNQRFSENVGDLKFPKLHFGVMKNQGKQSETVKKVVWSSAIDVNSDMESFVSIPGSLDIKIKVKSVAMVTHIIVEAISKAEVSAREIRSRIKTEKTEAPPDSTYDSQEDESIIQSLETAAMASGAHEGSSKRKPQKSKIDVVFGLHCHHVCVVLQDETSSTEEISEVLQVSVDHLFLAHLPSSGSRSNKNSKDQDQHQCLSLCLGSLQVDNQLYLTKGLYDFPVVFMAQTPVEFPDVAGMNVMEKLAVLKSVSMCHVQGVMEHDCLTHSLVKSLEVSISPITANINDKFVYRILKEFDILIPTSLSYPTSRKQTVKKLPRSFKSSSVVLSSPVKIEHLCIKPVSLLLSVHASLKLFIASDRTPLAFGKFEKTKVVTTSYHLIRALAMHYASGALFRAGIVVGSLEILGNPTGLIRSIGTGVADLVKKPYAGLTQGPGAFVSGVSSGMSSFVRNISAGMLTSVTNFASSVSRNMDRLSLDESHVERQEERRRQQPDGISSGLRQGLTGFGLSVLGAVAGLADQPIQNVIQSENSSERTARASPASGIVKGVGKGILGVFTKPLGGAAELVSQTGQGLLHGTGLADHVPLPRYDADVVITSLSNNSESKYVIKFLNSLPNAQLWSLVEADLIDITDSEVRVHLLLTRDLLIIINLEDDSQQQAFSLAEIDICNKTTNEQFLTILWKDSMQLHTSDQPVGGSKDRVEAFIDGTSGYVQVSPPDTPPLDDSQSDSSTSPVSRKAESPKYNFVIHPEIKSAFVAQFNLLKKRIMQRGFHFM
ncbi:intermembrane lipid transfer protein VPS13B-like [Saccostrea echinata]|uniref:intermembrane lipid transfer protein VPS13B-like n=1 Tax=Saccostrea echinata TaxID=191078 RepID=UPI002A833483|nr:intermembrane lipid transfer protein VPS13B-like [Saccostrea echinata]